MANPKLYKNLTLTPRTIEVLEAKLQDLFNKEIQHKLGMNQASVTYHLTKARIIFKKRTDPAMLVAYATWKNLKDEHAY